MIEDSLVCFNLLVITLDLNLVRNTSTTNCRHLRIQCTNPIPKYLDPLLCGGHCDNIAPLECAPEFRDASNSSQNLSAKLEESTTEAQSREKEEKGLR